MGALGKSFGDSSKPAGSKWILIGKSTGDGPGWSHVFATAGGSSAGGLAYRSIHHACMPGMDCIKLRSLAVVSCSGSAGSRTAPAQMSPYRSPNCSIPFSSTGALRSRRAANAAATSPARSRASASTATRSREKATIPTAAKATTGKRTNASCHLNDGGTCGCGSGEPRLAASASADLLSFRSAPTSETTAAARPSAQNQPSALIRISDVQRENAFHQGRTRNNWRDEAVNRNQSRRGRGLPRVTNQMHKKPARRTTRKSAGASQGIGGADKFVAQLAG